MEEVGVYVKTTNPFSVTFYEHFGFELKEEFLSYFHATFTTLILADGHRSKLKTNTQTFR